MSSDTPSNPSNRGRSTQPQPRADRSAPQQSGPPRKIPKRPTQSTSKYPYGADGGIFPQTTLDFDADPEQPSLRSRAGCANLFGAFVVILLLMVAQLPPAPRNL